METDTDEQGQGRVKSNTVTASPREQRAPGDQDRARHPEAGQHRLAV